MIYSTTYSCINPTYYLYNKNNSITISKVLFIVLIIYILCGQVTSLRILQNINNIQNGNNIVNNKDISNDNKGNDGNVNNNSGNKNAIKVIADSQITTITKNTTKNNVLRNLLEPTGQILGEGKMGNNNVNQRNSNSSLQTNPVANNINNNNKGQPLSIFANSNPLTNIAAGPNLFSIPFGQANANSLNLQNMQNGLFTGFPATNLGFSSIQPNYNMIPTTLNFPQGTPINSPIISPLQYANFASNPNNGMTNPIVMGNNIGSIYGTSTPEIMNVYTQKLASTPFPLGNPQFIPTSPTFSTQPRFSTQPSSNYLDYLTTQQFNNLAFDQNFVATQNPLLRHSLPILSNPQILHNIPKNIYSPILPSYPMSTRPGLNQYGSLYSIQPKILAIPNLIPTNPFPYIPNQNPTANEVPPKIIQNLTNPNTSNQSNIDTTNTSTTKAPSLAVNQVFTPKIIHNILSSIVPSLSNNNSNPQNSMPNNSNLTQSKNILINLSNGQQSIDITNISNTTLGKSLGKPNFSIKIQQLTQSNSNFTKDTGNFNKSTNLDTVSAVTTVLSIYANNQNNVATNSEANKNNQTVRIAIINDKNAAVNPNSNVIKNSNSSQSSNSNSRPTTIDTRTNTTSNTSSISPNNSAQSLNPRSNQSQTTGTNQNSNTFQVPILRPNAAIDSQQTQLTFIDIPISSSSINSNPNTNTLVINNSSQNTNSRILPKIGVIAQTHNQIVGPRLVFSPINIARIAARVKSKQTSQPLNLPPNYLKQLLPQTSPIDLPYKKYIEKYKPQLKTSINQIQQYKILAYKNNLALINQHNSKPNRKYNMGLNIFTDISQQQFSKIYTKLIIPDQIKRIALAQQILLKVDENKNIVYTVPQKININWACYHRKLDQSQNCGASWVVAALQSIEMTATIYKMNVDTFSLQQIIACGKTNKQISGCTQGYFNRVYDYVQNFGVGSSLQYPYDDKLQSNSINLYCNHSIIKKRSYANNKFFIKQSVRISYGDCNQVVNKLKTRILSVAIQTKYLQFYSKGTFTLDNFQNQNINHGVTLVGHHPQKGYLIKNSWGLNWGNNGFAYVDNSVGVCNYAMYPILQQQKDKQVYCE